MASPYAGQRTGGTRPSTPSYDVRCPQQAQQSSPWGLHVYTAVRIFRSYSTVQYMR